jgi:hypothetical protein
LSEIFIQFAVDHPIFLLLVFPLVAITGYLMGVNKKTPIYELTIYGTGQIVEVEPQIPEEELIAEQEAINAIVEAALVQELPPSTGAISIVPITRIQLNKWIRDNPEGEQIVLPSGPEPRRTRKAKK